MQTIAISGSFDPITNGHLYLIQEALNLGFQPVVYVLNNSTKKYMFDLPKRIEMVQKAIQESIHSGVEITVKAGNREYFATQATNESIHYCIRGIRNSEDLNYEFTLSNVNRNELGGLKTIFVIPPQELATVSSSFVKGLIGYNNWHRVVAKFVPTAVRDELIYNYLMNKFKDCIETKVMRSILDKYRESHRHYHNLNHLMDVIGIMENNNFNPSNCLCANG